ncbi:uncharacterized protein [Typha angustifolia]|uniref:uncharacterized protein n=1 Tax=Typha angustifolia TaxID=59011 RepID=UPI003C2D57AD
MDFFNDPWSAARSSFAPQPNPTSAKKPKVVSIPVHYVGSEPEVVKKRSPPAPERAPDRRVMEGAMAAAAAVKVQKVFRGFLVRKNMAIVRKVEAEADEIERMILAAQEVMRRDTKERVRVSEMLMRCLFRLDSVRGVRDYRKKVIRRVISLQEVVDAVSAAGETLEKGSEEVAAESQVPKETEETPEAGLEAMEVAEEGAAENLTLDPTPIEVMSPGETLVFGETKQKSNLIEELALETPETLESSSSDAADTSGDVAKEATHEGKEEDFVMVQMEGEEAPEPSESSVTTAEESLEASKSNLARDSAKEASESSSSREVMAESEKLQGLMAELCERSAQQCRIMGGLVQRVEKLERAVQRMEEKAKKKRRQGGNSFSSCQKKQW